MSRFQKILLCVTAVLLSGIYIAVAKSKPERKADSEAVKIEKISSHEGRSRDSVFKPDWLQAEKPADRLSANKTGLLNSITKIFLGTNR